MEKYGTEYALQNPEIKKEREEKAVETTMRRYGVPYSLMNNTIREKAKKTSNLHYGTDYPMQSEKFINQQKKMYMEKYGVDWHTKIPEEIEKKQKTLFENSTQKTSSQQLYIHNLFGGELNYPFKKFSLDIFIPEDNIDIEVDFGGHDLAVKTGKITQEEFNKREMIRENMIRSAGIKLVRFISPHDKLPSDEKLHELYEFAKEYLKTGHTWINFYFEENKYRNSEHSDESGAFFDFGNLCNCGILAKKRKEVA